MRKAILIVVCFVLIILPVVAQRKRTKPTKPKADPYLIPKMAEKGLLKHVHSSTVLRDNKAHYVLPDAFKGLTRNEKKAHDEKDEIN